MNAAPPCRLPCRAVWCPTATWAPTVMQMWSRKKSRRVLAGRCSSFRLPCGVKGFLKPMVQSGIGMLRKTPLPSILIGSPKGYITDIREWCDTQVSSRGVAFIPLKPGVEVKVPRADTLESEAHWQMSGASYRSPDTFMIKFTGGSARTWGSGNVITWDEKLVRQVSPTFKHRYEDHDAFWIAKYPKLRRIQGSVASISNISPDNYYHWFFEAIPRLHLLELANESADKFILSHGTPFQRATLDLLGISENVAMHPSASLHVAAETLLVPSLPGEIGYPVPWAVDYLKNKLVSDCEHSHGSLPIGGSIFLSRQSAYYRRELNFEQVSQVLQRHGVNVIDAGKYTLRDQIKIIRCADTIIGVHGAAMTNLTFARKGTRVLEIFSPNYVNPVYHRLSSISGLNYNYAIGLGERPPKGVDPHRVGDGVVINTAALDEFLRG